MGNVTLIRKANPSPQSGEEEKTECGEVKMPESKIEILNRHIKDVVEYLHSNLRTAVLAAMEEYATQQREGEKTKIPFRIGMVRKMITQLDKDEISFSRFVEMLNEAATGLTREEIYKIKFTQAKENKP